MSSSALTPIGKCRGSCPPQVHSHAIELGPSAKRSEGHMASRDHPYNSHISNLRISVNINPFPAPLWLCGDISSEGATQKAIEVKQMCSLPKEFVFDNQGMLSTNVSLRRHKKGIPPNWKDGAKGLQKKRDCVEPCKRGLVNMWDYEEELGTEIKKWGKRRPYSEDTK